MIEQDLYSGTMAEMTGPAIAAAAECGAGVLLPIGVMEHHGPHLPIGTDAHIATTLCRLTQSHAAERGREFVIAPPFYWGVNHVLSAFPATFRIRPDVAAALLNDIVDTLCENGFSDVLFVSHHGDLEHNRMLHRVMLDQLEQAPGRARWLYAPLRWRLFERLGCSGNEPFWVPWEPPEGLDTFKTTGVLGVHADEYETAAMVRFYPELVDFDVLSQLAPTQLGEPDLIRWRKGGAEAKAVTPDGYFGAPAPIDPDLWRHYDLIAREMAKALTTAQSDTERQE